MKVVYKTDLFFLVLLLISFHFCVPDKQKAEITPPPSPHSHPPWSDLLNVTASMTGDFVALQRLSVNMLVGIHSLSEDKSRVRQIATFSRNQQKKVSRTKK